MNGLFSCENFSAGYGKKEIIKNISFRADYGRLNAFMGLNGSGKTTLFKGICGLIPSSGKVFLDKTDILSLNDKSRAGLISYIPQNPISPAGIKVINMVLLGRNPRMKAFSSYSERDIEICENALKSLGILHFKNEFTENLSAGQRQMVFIARALAQEAEILVLDEPLSSLDYKNTKIIMEKLIKLKKTVLISLHDPNTALKYCSRIFILKDGGIIGSFSPEDGKSEILDNFNKLFGNINITQTEKGFFVI